MQNSPYFLCHYGVPNRSGKKGAGLWYKNGVLTPEGYRHYYAERKKQEPRLGTKIMLPKNTHPSHARYSKANRGINNKESKPESSTWKSKDAPYLSDAELNRRNSRLQREQQYKQMTKSRKKKAAEWIGKTAGAVFVATAIGVLKGKMNQAYKAKIDSFLKGDFIKLSLQNLRS